MTVTPFAGLEYLEPGQPLSADGYKFQSLDRRTLDRLGRLGAVTHRHDGHAALVNPTLAPTLATASTGGAIQAATPIFVTYTLVDADGGETLPVAAVSVTTAAGYADPFDVPAAAVDYAAGTLLAGNYSYAATVTDGLGGETVISPAVPVVVEPGHASGEVVISDLASLVSDSSGGAVGAGWRLWRSQGGGPWYLIGTGTADSFTDNGIAGDCSVAPPDATTTVGANTLIVTLPGGQPADAVSMNVYASLDGSFTSPAFLGNYATAPTDTTVTFTELLPTDGAPPSVSTAFPGANPIDPDTDIQNWTWKLPVANAAALPTVGNTNGDVRLTLDTHLFWRWDTAHWVRGPWWPPVDTAAHLPATGLLDGDLCMALDTHAVWVFNLAAAAWHTLGKPRENALTAVAGLAAGTETTEVLNMVGPAMQIYAVAANAACRVRLYPTAAMATADIARAASSDPNVAAQNGAYYEHTFAGAGTHIPTPAILAVMQEASIAPAIAANVSSPAGGAVQITLYGYRVE